MVKVNLEDVIEQLEFASESNKSYFQKSTGKIHLIPDELEIFAGEDAEKDNFIPEWEKEIIPVVKDIHRNPDDYAQFPDQFDINEYTIMERFCLSLSDDNLRDKMCASIKGSGAFQRFKNNIHHFGIADDWYKYKDEALRELAIDWCKENDIEYT